MVSNRCEVDGASIRNMQEKTIKRIVDSPPMAVKEAFKKAAVAYCRVFRSSKTFTFNGREYHYFYHSYNLAWRNERAVEVPIARELVLGHAGQSVLEVGNVLAHYIEIGHEVLDKYERAERVINEDAADFKLDRNYDLIISVSTLEHVGWDETPREPGKVIAAVNNLAGLLAPGGELIATAPLGFNPEFDRLLASGELPFSEVYAMKRVGGKNEWEQADLASVLGSRYVRRAFRADAIVVGLIKEGQVTNG